MDEAGAVGRRCRRLSGFFATCALVAGPVVVWSLSLAIIASVYIGFAVADGRSVVIATEIGVASAFVVLAAMAIRWPWLVVIALVAHGIKDAWQHRTQFVANTRWWPPFCLVVDFVAAALIAIRLLPRWR